MTLRFYEILILFLTYSLGGYFVICLCNAFRKEKNKIRVITKGPFAITFGIWQLILIVSENYIEKDLVKVLFLSAVIGTVLECGSEIIEGLITGKRKIFYSIGHTFIWGVLGIVSVFHWNSAIIAITRYINPWINMIILLIGYYFLTTRFIEGIWGLHIRKE